MLSDRHGESLGFQQWRVDPLGELADRRDRFAGLLFELREERRGLGGPELLGTLARRSQLHLQRDELLLGAAVECVLQITAGGIGGGEHPLAGCFEFGDLATQFGGQAGVAQRQPQPGGEVGEQGRLSGGDRLARFLRQRDAAEQLAIVQHRP